MLKFVRLEDVKLHGFTAVISRQTGFRGAEPRTVPMLHRGWCVGKKYLFFVVDFGLNAQRKRQLAD